MPQMLPWHFHPEHGAGEAACASRTAHHPASVTPPLRRRSESCPAPRLADPNRHCMPFTLAPEHAGPGVRAQLKISYSVHRNLNVKANNDRSFDYTLAAAQAAGQVRGSFRNLYFVYPSGRQAVLCTHRDCLDLQINVRVVASPKPHDAASAARYLCSGVPGRWQASAQTSRSERAQLARLGTRGNCDACACCHAGGCAAPERRRRRRAGLRGRSRGGALPRAVPLPP